MHMLVCEYLIMSKELSANIPANFSAVFFILTCTFLALCAFVWPLSKIENAILFCVCFDKEENFSEFL